VDATGPTKELARASIEDIDPVCNAVRPSVPVKFNALAVSDPAVILLVKICCVEATADCIDPVSKLLVKTAEVETACLANTVLVFTAIVDMNCDWIVLVPTKALVRSI
jgi:hypothetical protein